MIGYLIWLSVAPNADAILKKLYLFNERGITKIECSGGSSNYTHLFSARKRLIYARDFADANIHKRMFMSIH